MAIFGLLRLFIWSPSYPKLNTFNGLILLKQISIKSYLSLSSWDLLIPGSWYLEKFLLIFISYLLLYFSLSRMNIFTSVFKKLSVLLLFHLLFFFFFFLFFFFERERERERKRERLWKHLFSWISLNDRFLEFLLRHANKKKCWTHSKLIHLLVFLFYDNLCYSLKFVFTFQNQILGHCSISNENFCGKKERFSFAGYCHEGFSLRCLTVPIFSTGYNVLLKNLSLFCILIE